jgi:hypothetical protein
MSFLRMFYGFVTSSHVSLQLIPHPVAGLRLTTISAWLATTWPAIFESFSAAYTSLPRPQLSASFRAKFSQRLDQSF